MSEGGSPVTRFEQRLRGQSSATTLRGRVLETERSTLLQTIEALAADDAVLRAAALITGSRRRWIIGGGRSAWPAAQLAYDLSHVVSNVRKLSGEDDVVTALADLRGDDVLVAYSSRRYRASTIAAARAFHARAARVVVITDSSAAPITEFATETIVVPTSSASSSDTPTPLALVTHLIATLVTASAKGARRRLSDIESAAGDVIRFAQD